MRALLASVLFLAAASPALPDVPFVTLQAKRDVTSENRKGSGDVASTLYSEKLEFTIRNCGTNAVKGVLEWYFIARPNISKKPDYVFGKGTKSLSLAPMKSVSFKQMSPPLTQTKTVSKKSVRRSGPDVRGYVIRFVQKASEPLEPDTVLAVATDPDSLAAAAKDPGAWLDFSTNPDPYAPPPAKTKAKPAPKPAPKKK